MTSEQMEGINLGLDEAILHDAKFDLKLGTVKFLFEIFTIDENGVVPNNRTVSLVLGNIGRVMASLQHLTDRNDYLKTEPFTIDDFQKVIRSFGGSVYGTNFIRQGNDSLPAWIDHLSLDTELNGDSDYLIDLFQDGNDRKLDFRIWFGSLKILNLSGIEIPMGDFIAGGQRWWDAFNEDDPRTQGFGMYPLK